MLELDFVTVAFEIFNFLLLTALLYRFLFQPVMRNVQARTEKKEQLIRDMEQERRAAAEQRAELESRLAQAENEAATILAQAEAEAGAERTALLQQTHAEVERILAGAQLEASQLQQQTTEIYHQDLVETVLDTSRQVIERTAPPELHEALVKQLNDQVWSLGQDGMRQVQAIRRSLKDRVPTLSVTTARALSPEQQSVLLSTFTALADREVKLEIEIAPELVAGLRVRLGDTVMDQSIAGKVAELEEEVLRTISEGLLPEPIPAQENASKELARP